MNTRICILLALAALLLGAAPRSARAIEAGDLDAFFLALGTANISVRNSDALLSGSTLWGGFRLGLLSFVFLELGFGTVQYSDTVDVNGVTENFDFRTTGANYGMGILIPIRNLRLGARFQRHVNNKWSEKRTNADTGATISDISGDIDYDTQSVFGQFLEGRLEVGMRQDIIRETDSALESSFGVYLMWNFLQK